MARQHHAVIRVYDAAGNVIETHEHRGLCENLEGRFKVSVWRVFCDSWS